MNRVLLFGIDMISSMLSRCQFLYGKYLLERGESSSDIEEGWSHVSDLFGHVRTDHSVEALRNCRGYFERL